MKTGRPVRNGSPYLRVRASSCFGALLRPPRAAGDFVAGGGGADANGASDITVAGPRIPHLLPPAARGRRTGRRAEAIAPTARVGESANRPTSIGHSPLRVLSSSCFRGPLLGDPPRGTAAGPATGIGEPAILTPRAASVLRVGPVPARAAISSRAAGVEAYGVSISRIPGRAFRRISAGASWLTALPRPARGGRAPASPSPERGRRFRRAADVLPRRAWMRAAFPYPGCKAAQTDLRWSAPLGARWRTGGLAPSRGGRSSASGQSWPRAAVSSRRRRGCVRRFDITDACRLAVRTVRHRRNKLPNVVIKSQSCGTVCAG